MGVRVGWGVMVGCGSGGYGRLWGVGGYFPSRWCLLCHNVLVNKVGVAPHCQ